MCSASMRTSCGECARIFAAWLKLVQLVGEEPEYAPLLTAEGLARVARYADALGPSYKQLGSSRRIRRYAKARSSTRQSAPG